MYRVLITGDTHGHIQSVLDLMENVEFDEVIHLGDYVKDAAAIGNIYKEIPVHFVRGNNDFSGLAAREKGALIALHGHTHVPEDLMVNSVRIFSPGSPTYPRMSERSVGILEADGDYFEMAHYYIK